MRQIKKHNFTIRHWVVAGSKKFLSSVPSFAVFQESTHAVFLIVNEVMCVSVK